MDVRQHYLDTTTEKPKVVPKEQWFMTPATNLVLADGAPSNSETRNEEKDPEDERQNA
jgi:hypothetical protein